MSGAEGTRVDAGRVDGGRVVVPGGEDADGADGHDDRQLADVLRPQVAARLQAGDGASGDGGGGRQPGRWRQRVDEAVGQVLDAHAHAALAAGRRPLEVAVEARVRQALVDSFVGAGGLQALLDDERVETINVNGADNVWVHYADGSRARAQPVAASDEELVALLRQLGARAGAHERRFSTDHPELSMQLPGGARLHAIQHVSDRVVVSIRRHRLLRVRLADLVELGELSSQAAALFAAMVRARFNIVVSGGPAVGKTTFLRALTNAIDPYERLVTVEDSFELALDKQAHPNLVAMQARQPNLEGAGEFNLDACVRASLRLSPDRVIVGEVRGAEVVTMAKAMSLGMDGSLATVHASSSRQALLRLVTYAMEPPALYPREAAAALVGGAVHFVVHLDRTREGTRVVSSVREVTGDDGGQVASNEVYRPGADLRAVPGTSLRHDTLQRLAAAGLDPTAGELDRGWQA